MPPGLLDNVTFDSHNYQFSKMQLNCITSPSRNHFMISMHIETKEQVLH